MKFGDIMKKIELLAPAGNMNSLKAAIMAGCDAVYLGGKLFGARAFSKNFINDELIEAIQYSHLYGVKVYVTVNTLIYENEVDSFLEYIDFLHKNNVDAVIMQDIGMISLVRKTFPNLEIHASTQFHNHNIEDLNLCKDIIYDLYPEYQGSYKKYIENNNFMYIANSFITSSENFDKICEFILNAI